MRNNNIQFFCPRWGSDNLSWLAFLLKAKLAGYDGVEFAVKSTTSVFELDDICRMAEDQGMLLIAQHYDTNSADFQEHKAVYSAWFEKIKGFPFVKINSQTGRDIFSVEQNSELIVVAGAYEAISGIPVLHETHRGKFSFAAHITKNYLNAIPELKLTLDASHWVNVAESYLEDQQETMELAISRTRHIHARVGYPEGPQIPDPGAVEWQEAVNRHLAWWDRVVSDRQGKGLTITSEFGPYPYLVELPHTRQPIADQWAMNVYMMNLLKERYA